MKAPCIISWNRYLLIVGLLGLMAVCNKADAQLHTVILGKEVFGPNGTNAVRVGERVTSIITLVNFDPFGDSWTITSVYDVVHHKSMSVTSTNLITAPVTLRLNDELVVTNTYTV